MKRDRNFHAVRVKSGFTLIEMIGVMAILTIMAAVLTPNVLHSIDRAAVVAEQQTLHNLGGQVKKYLNEYGAPPTIVGWDAQIANYAELSQLDIAVNKRQNGRVFLLDPDPLAFQQRAIILSSMRQGMLLPTQANINTPAKFAALWGTLDGAVPSVASWGGWTAMAADYLVIERINFKSEYRSVQLQNNGNAHVVAPAIAPTVRYEIWAAKVTGGPIQFGTLAPGVGVSPPVVSGVRLLLYAGPSAAGGVDYNYLVSTTDRTLSFDGTHWSPQ
jgi:prepilin-type N-terminal cleavage/methylation domain-containing protein